MCWKTNEPAFCILHIAQAKEIEHGREEAGDIQEECKRDGRRQCRTNGSRCEEEARARAREGGPVAGGGWFCFAWEILLCAVVQHGTDRCLRSENLFPLIVQIKKLYGQKMVAKAKACKCVDARMALCCCLNACLNLLMLCRCGEKQGEAHAPVARTRDPREKRIQVAFTQEERHKAAENHNSEEYACGRSSRDRSLT